MYPFKDKKNSFVQGATENFEEFKKIQKVIAPFIKKVIVKIPQPSKWESTDQKITKVSRIK